MAKNMKTEGETPRLLQQALALCGLATVVLASLARSPSYNVRASTMQFDMAQQECFDLLIPYHPSDQVVFVKQGGLKSIQRHVQGWRKTFIISAGNATFVELLGERTIWLPETRFELAGLASLRSWFQQQAFKMMAPLQVPELCNAYLVLDADLHFVRDWTPRGGQPGTFKYLLPTQFQGGHQRDLGARAQMATFHTLRLNSLTSPGTLCTVHHHMLMQKDVMAELLTHVLHLHGLTLIELLVRVQAQFNWWSEYDVYLAFLFHRFRTRMEVVDFPYLHAREPSRCTNADAAALQKDTDIVFMGCHDHFQGHDICASSANNCTSSVAFCERSRDTGMCKMSNVEVMPCPILVRQEGQV